MSSGSPRAVAVLCTLAALAVSSCQEQDSVEGSRSSSDSAPAASGDSIQVAVAQWTEYLESSDEGLWEGNEGVSVRYSRTGSLWGEDDLDVPVYSPFGLAVRSDTIYVTDSSTREVVALDSEGRILWKTGGEGEGPGHFAQMTTLAASGQYVAVLNRSLRRIEFFSRDGIFSHNLQFTRPQDIVILDDTTFLVASTEEAGGDIHVLDSDRGVVRSFGEAEIDEYEGVLRPDLLRLCANGEGRVALFNRYEGLLVIYDIETEDCIYRGSRRYPSSPHPPEEFIAADGERRTMFFPIGGNVFQGAEGMLNVVICNYMDDGSFLSDPEYLDFAPVTAIDRYNWDGRYLDTYCLPDSCINFVVPLSGGRLVGRNFAEGAIKLFERI